MNEKWKTLEEKSFKGNVSVIGHSLGSLILFDILSHSQVKIKNSTLLKSILFFMFSKEYK